MVEEKRGGWRIWFLPEYVATGYIQLSEVIECNAIIDRTIHAGKDCYLGPVQQVIISSFQKTTLVNSRLGVISAMDCSTAPGLRYCWRHSIQNLRRCCWHRNPLWLLWTAYSNCQPGSSSACKYAWISNVCLPFGNKRRGKVGEVWDRGHGDQGCNYCECYDCFLTIIGKRSQSIKVLWTQKYIFRKLKTPTF